MTPQPDHSVTASGQAPLETGTSTAMTTDATPPTSRRTVLMGAGGLAMGLGTLGFIGKHLIAPERGAAPTGVGLPDIQHDIGKFMPPPQTFNDGGGNIPVGLPPRSTVFVTAKLHRTPTQADQAMLSDALDTIEQHYQFGPGGIFTFISYGLPYFNRLPSGLVAQFMPRLDFDNSRFVLEEAVPSPTDVSPQNPGIVKQTFNVPVVIESNDFLITLRSDESQNISDVLAWLGGSNRLNGNSVPSPALFNGLASVTSSRAMFAQIGMPRFIADINALPFAGQINPDSPMWMGFLDQQVNGAGPPEITTFAGNSSAHITTARPGDYFDNGSVQHLSHVIEDLAQFYALPSATDAEGEPFTERVQYMFRSNPIPSKGNSDQFTNGGGPAIFANVFQGSDDADNNAQGNGTFNGGHRLGHLSGLQRSSRAADGTPMHIRNDGPGFDSMDVPDGSNQPKLQFMAFFPTAEFFRVMRVNQASLDLQKKFAVADDDNGLERFTTATRRQNYLVPPRRSRAFPLVEFTGAGNSGS
ncbi:MAG TPA: hypothetical protein VGS19_22420 [Streptosporangiaceae bacterium]|nr:hypothetical protein [Streptosporangiaceae bacterium]